jgi:hypothetical protein
VMEPNLEALVRKYRALHRECRVVNWTPDAKGFNVITADARCPLCRKADDLCGEPVDSIAELKK